MKKPPEGNVHPVYDVFQQRLRRAMGTIADFLLVGPRLITGLKRNQITRLLQEKRVLAEIQSLQRQKEEAGPGRERCFNYDVSEQA